MITTLGKLTSRRLLMLLAALTLLSVCLEARAGLIGVQLVVNGDAETGDTSGWVSTGVEVLPRALAGDLGLPPGVDVGNFSFWGGLGPAASQSLTQSIDVSPLAAQIDAGEITSSFSVLLQGRAEGAIFDRVSGTLTYRSGTGDVLSSVAFQDTNITPGVFFLWDQFADERVVPAGTRSVRIFIDTTRGGGVSTDALFDNVSLVLSAPTAVPEPSSVLLFAVGGAMLVFFRRGQRRTCRRLEPVPGWRSGR